MRSGTDNVPGIAGLAKSAEIVYKHFDEQTAQMRACKRRLIEGFTGAGRCGHPWHAGRRECAADCQCIILKCAQ